MYKVPAIVVKYSNSFHDFVVIDSALYGNGSMKQILLCLVQNGNDKFDYLELNGKANVAAHRIYQRIYKNGFKEPAGYARHQEACSDEESDEDSTHTSISGIDAIEGQLNTTNDDGDDEELSAPSEAGEDDNELSSGEVVDGEQGPSVSSSDDEGAKDASPANVSGITTSTESSSRESSKRDGYQFVPTIHSKVPRKHILFNGLYFFTNVVKNKDEYKYFDYVKVKRYPPSRYLNCF